MICGKCSRKVKHTIRNRCEKCYKLQRLQDTLSSFLRQARGARQTNVIAARIRVQSALEVLQQ